MRTVGAAAVVLLLTCAVVFAAFAQSAPRKRAVEMEITLPNGAVAHASVPDGEGAIVRLPDKTRFGFVPTVRGGDDASTVIVTIWDVDKVPNRELGRVEVEISGPPMQSDTTPSFAIRVPRVVVRPK